MFGTIALTGALLFTMWPSAQALRLSPQQIADLVAFLETLSAAPDPGTQ